MIRVWEELPDELKVEEVRPYYEILRKKRCSIFFKRVFDIVVSFLMLIMLSPVFMALVVLIKVDSKGPVFYKQERVTQYCRKFRIHKFRSMCDEADKNGTLVTVSEDSRVTRVGKILRKCRLDEVLQLIDVLQGNMSFVGARPEVPKYVKAYTPEMMATLLLPAGITSEASIRYKDEAGLLDAAEDVERVYIEEVLPEKMKWNLKSIERFKFFNEILTMIRTVFAVLGKEYE